MSDKYEYLTDEELEKLISETESEGLLQAPPGFETSVLLRLEKELEATDLANEDDLDSANDKAGESADSINKDKSEIVSFEDKKRQYSRFCFQVCMAMAAAILFIIIAPMFAQTKGGQMIRQAASQMQPEEYDRTSFVADVLGNHYISDAISNTGNRKQDGGIK